MTTQDDGTIRWWLRLADEITQIRSRSGRATHAEVVREAIGHHTDRLLRWNLSVCDSLDISISQAPDR